LIVGFSHLGRYCAKLLKPFGCRVIGVNRNPAIEADPETGTVLVRFDQMGAALAESDHVVLLLPSGKETDGIFTRDHLKAMKPSAILHNMGRGTVVLESDVVSALEEKEIAGAFLDVFEKEPLPADSKLWKLDNVLISPHASAFYDDYGDLFVEELIEKLPDILSLQD